MTPEQSRAAFESWYVETWDDAIEAHGEAHRMGGQYKREDAQMSWLAWQAAIAATGEDAEKWRALQQSFSRPDQK